MIRHTVAAVLLTTLAAGAQPAADAFTIARVHYDGGGDWYSDPSSLPNLLAFVRAHTRVLAADTEARVRLTDEELQKAEALATSIPGATERLALARELLDELVTQEDFADFLTIIAYERLHDGTAR